MSSQFVQEEIQLNCRNGTFSNVREAYSVFKEEFLPLKIGLGKFAELRPVNVLLNAQTPANVCLCVYHENYFSAVDALHGLLPAIPSYSKDFVASCLLSADEEACWFGECQHDGCGFAARYPLPYDNEVMKTDVKWKMWTDHNGHLAKTEQAGTLIDLHVHISSMSRKFFAHSFIKRMQSRSYEQDKAEASKPESDMAVLQLDFAENYTCVAQDEIQSAHWNQAQVTLFTSVMWRAGDQIQSHVVVSDYMSHDKTAVMIFVDRILEENGTADLKQVRIWTDGTASQFKNRYIMASMELLSKRHGVRIIWNFSATSHGKGPVDGVEAALKRNASTKVRARQCCINTAEEFCHVVADSSVAVTLISSEMVKNRESLLGLGQIFDEVPTIQGISSYHCHQLNKPPKRYSSQVVDTDHVSEEESMETNDHMVAVLIAGKRCNIRYIYLAQVIRRDGNDVCVLYLHKNGEFYNWPTNPDESCQPEKDILCTVPYGKLMNNRGQLQFTPEVLTSVRERALAIDGVDVVHLK